jgi:two-component system response regulator FixJ
MAEPECSDVYVVDDDKEFADSLTCLLEADGFKARSFPLGQTFLDALATLVPGTIMLDIKMPGMDGITVLEKLKGMDVDWPVIMMTGHGDIPLAVRCIQLGAIEFVEKPFEEAKLLEVLSEATNVLNIRLAAREEVRTRDERLQSLSKREREVLARLTTGLTNKEIALTLNVSVRTVEMHRANLIRRLGVRTTPEAIRIALEHGEPQLNILV